MSALTAQEARKLADHYQELANTYERLASLLAGGLEVEHTKEVNPVKRTRISGESWPLKIKQWFLEHRNNRPATIAELAEAFDCVDRDYVVRTPLKKHASKPGDLFEEIANPGSLAKLYRVSPEHINDQVAD